MADLILRPPHRRRVRELSEAAWPCEACGLLEGVTDGNGADGISADGIGADGIGVRVLACHYLPNIHAEPRRRYTIDPQSFLQLEHAARARGRAIVGVWHSHPHGDPAPSTCDHEQAWPGWSYLIAGVTNAGMIALRCWRMDADGYTEQPIIEPGRRFAGKPAPAAGRGRRN